MPVTKETIDINCLPDDAFAFIASPKNQLDINDSAQEIRDYHGGELQIGDQWIVVMGFMGQEIVSTYTLLEVDKPIRLVFDNTSDAASMRIEWLFESISTGTRVTFHSDGKPKGFFASIILQLAKSNFDKNVRESLQNLKIRLEAESGHNELLYAEE